MKYLSFFFVATALLWSCSPSQPAASAADNEAEMADSLRYPEEKHLKNIRQLTFGGDNAEAYFSFDGRYLVLQRAHPASGIACDQIFYGEIPTAPGQTFDLMPVSNGLGRTTCAYFLPGDSTIIYASTHLAADTCPPSPDRSKIKKYVWPIYNSYELFIADRKGNILRQLTDNDAYDAEATVSPRGDKIVFTSTRNGDIDLYTMNIDGSEVQQITDELGYDGGAFFSPDGSKLIFRASRFNTEAAAGEYRELLAQGLVAPTEMELYICNVDGSDLRALAPLGKANWAPFFHPSGDRVLFSSNHTSESGRLFNIFMVGLDGSGLEQITFDDQFDSFPMFSPDGRQLVFASNRNNGGTRETNVFIADWVD